MSTTIRKTYTESTDLYRLVHDRLRAARGRADSHDCVDCGQRAKEWALKPNPVGETHPASRDGKVLWLSLLLTDYQPMCAGCHRRMDRATKRAQHYLDEGVADYVDYGDGVGYRAISQPTLDDGAWVTL